MHSNIPKEHLDNLAHWTRWLEHFGFKQAIAGQADFIAACNACQKMLERTATEKRRVGIIISGEYGCGKTRLARAIASIINHNPNSLPTRIIMLGRGEVNQLTDDWQIAYGKDFCKMNIVLDDLGAEKEKNDFGVKYEIVNDFILKYHDEGQGYLIITTNDGESEIDARYGGRLRSRLKDMCVPLRLNGCDKRSWEGNADLFHEAEEGYETFTILLLPGQGEKKIKLKKETKGNNHA